MARARTRISQAEKGTAVRYDVCIIGSGAGAAPVAHTLSEQGFRVLVLEKGPYLTEKDFTNDEIAVSRRSV
jgi:choline dehydrogenase-like flavoprotein